MASIPANLNDIRALIDQDRKKAGLLAVLTLAFIVILARSFGGGTVAAETAAAILPATKSTSNDDREAEPMIGVYGSPAVRSWIDAPLPPLTRNLFVLDLSRYRPAPEADMPLGQDELANLDTFVPTVDMAQDRVRIDAQALELQQVWIAADPGRSSAVINGRLVRPGQSIASFRLISVSHKGAIVERDGIEVTVKMRKK
ncbi:MAG: hypothetical protein AAGD32_09540 [Planctomycetota bacterium]